MTKEITVTTEQYRTPDGGWVELIYPEDTPGISGGGFCGKDAHEFMYRFRREEIKTNIQKAVYLTGLPLRTRAVKTTVIKVNSKWEKA